jgi:hypothetical protein
LQKARDFARRRGFRVRYRKYGQYEARLTTGRVEAQVDFDTRRPLYLILHDDKFRCMLFILYETHWPWQRPHDRNKVLLGMDCDGTAMFKALFRATRALSPVGSVPRFDVLKHENDDEKEPVPNALLAAMADRADAHARRRAGAVANLVALAPPGRRNDGTPFFPGGHNFLEAQARFRGMTISNDARQ